MDEPIVILEVGHNSRNQGAENKRTVDLSEFNVNKDIAMDICKKLWANGIKSIVMMQGSVKNKIEKINGLDLHDLLKIPTEKQLTKILVSLHFNAFKGYISNSSGCEVLIAKERIESTRLANLLLSEFLNLSPTNRGIKTISQGKRGYAILAKTSVDYAVLCEPLFIDSEEGEALSDPGVIEFLVDAYYSGIINFIKEG